MQWLREYRKKKNPITKYSHILSYWGLRLQHMDFAKGRDTIQDVINSIQVDSEERQI